MLPTLHRSPARLAGVLALVLAMLLSVVPAAVAQVVTATVTGTVTGTSDFSAASVTVHDERRGAHWGDTYRQSVPVAADGSFSVDLSEGEWFLHATGTDSSGRLRSYATRAVVSGGTAAPTSGIELALLSDPEVSPVVLINSRGGYGFGDGFAYRGVTHRVLIDSPPAPEGMSEYRFFSTSDPAGITIAASKPYYTHDVQIELALTDGPSDDSADVLQALPGDDIGLVLPGHNEPVAPIAARLDEIMPVENFVVRYERRDAGQTRLVLREGAGDAGDTVEVRAVADGSFMGSAVIGAEGGAEVVLSDNPEAVDVRYVTSAGAASADRTIGVTDFLLELIDPGTGQVATDLSAHVSSRSANVALNRGVLDVETLPEERPPFTVDIDPHDPDGRYQPTSIEISDAPNGFTVELPAEPLNVSGQLIRGTVRDESGATVPSAPVELLDELGRAIAYTHTDSSGRYSLPAPTGTVLLTAEGEDDAWAQTVLTVAQDAVVEESLGLVRPARSGAYTGWGEPGFGSGNRFYGTRIQALTVHNATPDLTEVTLFSDTDTEGLVVPVHTWTDGVKTGTFAFDHTGTDPDSLHVSNMDRLTIGIAGTNDATQKPGRWFASTPRFHGEVRLTADEGTGSGRIFADSHTAENGATILVEHAGTTSEAQANADNGFDVTIPTFDTSDPVAYVSQQEPGMAASEPQEVRLSAWALDVVDGNGAQVDRWSFQVVPAGGSNAVEYLNLDDGGRGYLHRLPAGEYTLRSYSYDGVSGSLRLPQAGSYTQTLPTATVEFGNVAVYVLDDFGHESHATVTVEDSSGNVTDMSRAWDERAWTTLPDGTYLVQAVDGTLRSDVLEVTVTDGVATPNYETLVVREPQDEVSLVHGSDAAEAGPRDGWVDVTRTGDLSQPLTVTYQVSGDATASVDYVELFGELTFAPDQSGAVISVSPIDDDEVESHETVSISLDASSDYVLGSSSAADVLIEDDDVATPVVTLTADATSVDEPSTEPVRVTITSDIPADTGGLDVVVATGGTATDGGDYDLTTVGGDPVDGSVPIPAGETSVVIEVRTTDDSEVEGDEQITIELGASEAYQRGTESSAAITLVEDDVHLPMVSIRADGLPIAEDGSEGTTSFTVELDRPAPEGGLEVGFDLAGDATVGSDYRLLDAAGSPPVSPISVPAGAMSVELALEPLDDDEVEEDESVQVTLRPSDAYDLDAASSAEIVITSEDRLPVASIASAADRLDEMDGATVVTVTLDQPAPEGGLDVLLGQTGTAGVGVDYDLADAAGAAVEDRVSFPAGASTVRLSLAAIDDVEDEADEQVTLELLPDAGYELDVASDVSVVVADDDREAFAYASPWRVAAGSNPRMIVISGDGTHFGDSTEVTVTDAGGSVVPSDRRIIDDRTIEVDLGERSVGSHTITATTAVGRDGESVEVTLSVVDPSATWQADSLQAGYGSRFVGVSGAVTSWTRGETTVQIVDGSGTAMDHVGSVRVKSPTYLDLELKPGLPAGDYEVVVTTGLDEVRDAFSVRAPNVCATAYDPMGAPTGLAAGWESGEPSPWRIGDVADAVSVTVADDFTSPFEGNSMLVLGTPATEDAAQPVGANEACLDFSVDQQTESLVYDVFTYDNDGFDRFELTLERLDADGAPTGQVIQTYDHQAFGASGDTSLRSLGWRSIELDLAGLQGELVRLTLNAGGSGDDQLPTWAYIDAVGAEEAPKAPKRTAEVEGEEASVSMDPRTGEVTVAMQAAEVSDIEFEVDLACAEGVVSQPTLLYGSEALPLAPVEGAEGTYVATVTAELIRQSGNGAISTTHDCIVEGQPVATSASSVGSIQLYDPSGYVTDEATGEPIVGAEVTLHHVPGWTPSASSEYDAEANECQGVKGDGWSQPAPTDDGVVVPASTLMISPNVNPMPTDGTGYYGWDVAEGCWYVTVTHEDYEPVTSPVVGVPPEVTDLDLTMTRKPVPTSGGGGGGGAPAAPTTGNASTDTDGDGATASQPSELTIEHPDGTVTVVRTDADAPAGYEVVGRSFDVTATPASATDPMVLTFAVDGSTSQAGDVVAILTDGILVPPCEGDEHDPCVRSRSRDGDDLIIEVVTTTASVWSAVVLDVAALGHVCPEDAMTESAFTDADGTHGRAIDCVAAWDIAKGTGDGSTFTPKGVVNRGQMASFIKRMVEAAGATLPDGSDVEMDDTSGSVHRSAIHQLVEAGIAKGTSATAFSPNVPVTRAQMATFLASAYAYVAGADMATGDVSFEDAKGDTHESSIRRIATYGVTTGNAAGDYAPGETVTREQMASFLARMLNLLCVEEGVVAAA